MHYKTRLFLLIVICCSTLCAASDVYKYKDKNGNWVFTDKAPSGTKKLEKIKVAQTQVSIPEPRVYGEKIAGRFYLFAENYVHGPVQIQVVSPSNAQKKINHVLGPRETATIYEGNQELKNLKVSWLLGDDKAKPVDYLYRVPIGTKKKYIVSQGFNGEFSHFNAHSKFAIDVNMESGTVISAARPGTVMWVKDDSYVGGGDPSYMSKANFIAVVHDDGTYATYLHLQGGSSFVRAGDQVKAGDRLGKSGATGYATGPHLHFVVQRNSGMNTVSLPFEFAGKNGTRITPALGMQISSKLEEAKSLLAEGNGHLNTQNTQVKNKKKINNSACEKARIDYIILAQKSPVYWDDENQLRVQSRIDYYQGKRTLLDESQRAAEVRNVKDKMLSACANPNDNNAIKNLSKKWLRQEHCNNARHNLDQLKQTSSLTPTDVLKRKTQEAQDICSGKTALPN